MDNDIDCCDIITPRIPIGIYIYKAHKHSNIHIHCAVRIPARLDYLLFMEIIQSQLVMPYMPKIGTEVMVVVLRIR